MARGGGGGGAAADGGGGSAITFPAFWQTPRPAVAALAHGRVAVEVGHAVAVVVQRIALFFGGREGRSASMSTLGTPL